jgi:HEAT repeat protein
MLSERDSFTFSNLITFWNRSLDRVPIWARYSRLYRKPAGAINYEAEIGFEILGFRAEQAVPALMKIYEQNFSQASQQATAQALAAIGPKAQQEAFPLFLRFTASSNSAERETAVFAIYQMSGNQAQMLTIFTNALTDANFMTREIAIKGLARLGTNAQEAVPALTQLLSDNDRFIRHTASEALSKIAPAAFSKSTTSDTR